MANEQMDNEQVVKSIQQSLVEQQDNLTSLLQILQNELQAINSRDGIALEQMAKDKLVILNNITKIDKKLPSASLQQLKQTIPSIDDDIASINEQIKHCKKLNDINAHAAHQTQLAVKNITDILIGSMKSLTYDKQGLSQSGSLLGKTIKA